MKILLDECLPRDLRKLLPPHQVSTVPDVGWSGVTNGKLLNLAEQKGFEVFVTVDQNLPAQNPTAGTRLIVMIMRVKSNRLEDVQPLVPNIISLLSEKPRTGVYNIP